MSKIITSLILLNVTLTQAQNDLAYHNYAPVISPDGKTIAYYAKINGNWDLYSMDIDGQNKKRLTTHTAYDGEPSWSPDGSKLVFTSDRDGDYEIYIIDPQKMSIEQVTENVIPDDFPTFAPDGKRIVYRSKLGSQWFVYSIEPGDKNGKMQSNINVEGRIRWSTHGTSLSFVTRHQNRYAISRIDSQGNPYSLTFTKFDLPGNPHFSDSEGVFVFDAHRDGSDSSGDGKWELWTIEPGGDNLQQITNNEFDDWGATWSFDSKFLVYAGKGLNNTSYEIHSFDLKKQSVNQLTFKK